MPTSTKLALRYPVGSDSPDVVRDLGYLKDDLEANVGVLAQRTVLETGQVGQTRAGRNLAWDDFWDFCGLGVLPIAIWNGTVSDVSGNNRHLTNKGAVPTTAIGVAGAANTAALFAGSGSQALYADDSSYSNAFRIRTGSYGIWFKVARKDASFEQYIFSKYRATGNQRSFRLMIPANSTKVRSTISLNGTTTQDMTSVADVVDDKWHFAVVTFDGATHSLYIDGVLDISLALSGTIFAGTGPLNIGAFDADAGTAASNPFYGRTGPAFVCHEVLNPDQIRTLYGVRITHGMGSVAPRRASLRVSRRRLGALLANGDFPSNPFRCFNLNGATYTDLNGGTAIAPVGGGTLVAAAGPSGGLSEAIHMSGAHAGVASTDAGFPGTTTDRSYGGWFNSSVVGVAQNLTTWGASTSNHASTFIETTGLLTCKSGADMITGPFVADGKWHHFAVTETNSPTDGVKRKLYLDGVLVGQSLTLTSITITPTANGFRVGASVSGTQLLDGLISRVFVYAGLLSAEQIATIRLKSTGGIPASPKDSADHIEAVYGSDLIFVGDDLDPHQLIDLEVSR